MLKFKRKVLLSKIEGTYGVDAAPAAATDAILARNMRVMPLRLGVERRELVKTWFANEGDIVIGQWSEISFDVEMAGAGTAADTVAKYGPLLRGCGLAQTVNAAVSVQYDPVSTAEESLSKYFQVDGRQHKMLGCRGNRFGWTIRAGG